MRSQSARDCVALLARRHFWGPSGSIPELCHEMDSLRPAVSKLQGKTERADSLPVPWSLFSSCSLLPPYRLHRVSARGPNVPRASNTLGPAMNTPSVWLLYCEIHSTLLVPSFGLLLSSRFPLSRRVPFFFFLCSFFCTFFRGGSQRTSLRGTLKS